MYIIRKEKKGTNQQAGYVKMASDQRRAVVCETYKQAQKIADAFNRQNDGLIYIVDLQDACDCTADLMIHA